MNTQSNKQKNFKRILVSIAVFAMLSTIMFVSKKLMEVLPNIHLLGMLTMTYTLVFRGRALIPIYVYVFLDGLFSGFSIWWYPYLYVWTILWAVTMMLPKKMTPKAAKVVYPAICCLHGLAFGILYAPAQAFFFGFDFKQTLVWIASGIPFDVLHGIGNLFAGLLIFPLAQTLKIECKSILPAENKT